MRELKKLNSYSPDIEVLRPPTIVIIDDDVELERAIGRILRANYDCVVKGYRSVEAFLAAVDMGKKGPNRVDDVDLILLDFHLPGQDGPKLVDELEKRESVILERSYIMGITSDSERVVYNEFRNAGIQEILHKPLEMLDYRRIASKAYDVCANQDAGKSPQMVKKYI